MKAFNCSGDERVACSFNIQVNLYKERDCPQPTDLEGTWRLQVQCALCIRLSAIKAFGVQVWDGAYPRIGTEKTPQKTPQVYWYLSWSWQTWCFCLLPLSVTLSPWSPAFYVGRVSPSQAFLLTPVQSSASWYLRPSDCASTLCQIILANGNQVLFETC